jgi:hypothetical protein
MDYPGLARHVDFRVLLHFSEHFLEQFLGRAAIEGSVEGSKVASQFCCPFHEIDLETVIGDGECRDHTGYASSDYERFLVDPDRG